MDELVKLAGEPAEEAVLAASRNLAERTGRTHDYCAFGLKIRSTIPLPELCASAFDCPDVSIVRRPTAPDFPPPEAPETHRVRPDGLEMLWPAAGRFRIMDRSVIEVEAAPGADDRLLGFPLLGPVMAVLLHLRGLLVIHASAVRIGKQGVAFLGDKMAGKSTTAATFVAQGHQLVTDDVLGLAFDGDDAIRMQPAFPQLKLCETTSQLVRISGSEALPHVLPNFFKRQHRLQSDAPLMPVPPGWIFILKRGTEASIRRLPPDRVLGALMHNSYVKSYIGFTLTPASGARHLHQIAALGRQARVCELEVPGSVERLSEVVRAVERHIRQAREMAA